MRPQPTKTGICPAIPELPGSLRQEHSGGGSSADVSICSQAIRPHFAGENGAVLSDRMFSRRRLLAAQPLRASQAGAQVVAADAEAAGIVIARTVGDIP